MGRTSGKSLKVRQQTQTSDTENLVGRALKHHLTQETPAEVEVKRQNLSDEKEIQVDLENQITAKDLTCEHPSEKYWQKLAEKRQIALEESLEENAQLTKKIEFLKGELNKYKQMLDEANSFVEVIKEELYNSATDDTGIDVNDVSTTDDTADDTAKDGTDLDATKETDLDATKETDLDATKETDLEATKKIE